MSQEKLGNALGVSYQQIQKYEVGTHRVMASRLWDIAEALEVDIGFFFEGIQKRTKPRKSPTATKAVGQSARR